MTIDYSNCGDAPTTFGDIDSSRVSSYFKSPNPDFQQAPQWMKSQVDVPYGINNNGYTVSTRKCSLRFDIPDDIGPPVYLYYRLSNFYQNHRRYVKSYDQDQLSGSAVSNSSINGGTCQPLELNATGFAYYPCGLIANSVFNDTFHSPFLLDVAGSDASNQTYVMTNNSVAWPSDRSLYGVSQYTTNQVAPPPNWIERYPSGYNEDFPLPDLQNDDNFQVWMRTAGLPTFSKLALRNDNTSMATGRYQLDIFDCNTIPVARNCLTAVTNHV